MSKKLYVSPSGVARKVNSIYVGINNVTQKIKRVYIGDENGIAKFIWGEQGILPALYQQVEYLQGTGTQYIDTGVYISVNTLAFQIDCKLTTNTYSNSATLMGCMLGSTSRFYVSCLTSTEVASKKKRIDIGLGGGWWTDSAQADLNRHVYKNDMQNLKVYKDGVSKNKSGGTYSKATNSNVRIGIFRGYRWDGTWGTGLAQGYLYNAKIWQGGTLIHNYYPCYRKTDYVAGLYDMVANTFLANAGTGTFGVGPKYEAEL